MPKRKHLQNVQCTMHIHKSEKSSFLALFGLNPLSPAEELAGCRPPRGEEDGGGQASHSQRLPLRLCLGPKLAGHLIVRTWFGESHLRRQFVHKQTREITSRSLISLLQQYRGLYPCSTKTREVLGNPSRRPRDFLRPEKGKSRKQRGWISQYLTSFDGVRTLSYHQSFSREWIRKSFL